MLLSFAVLFACLGDGSIGNNDDAIYSFAASRMLREDTWVTYHWHGVQLHETYPPIHFCLLRLSIGLFGENEFALRLPAALGALISILFVFALTTRISKSPLAGLLAGLTLLASVLFYTLSRSVHLEMSLIASTLAAYWSYVRAWKDERYLLICGLCIGLAYLSKTLMAAFVLVPIAIDLLVSGRAFFRNKYFWAGSGIAFFSGALWHLGQSLSSGVLHLPFHGKRLVEQLAGHFSLWDLVRDLARTEKFSIPLWIIGLIWLVRKFRNERGARLMIYGVLAGCAILLSTRTVMMRYFLPVIPVLAVGTGCFLGTLKIKYMHAYTVASVLILLTLFFAGNFYSLVNPDYSPGVKEIARSIEKRENRVEPVLFFKAYCASFDYYFKGRVSLLTDFQEAYERYVAHEAMRLGLGVKLVSTSEMTRKLTEPGVIAATILPFEKTLREYLFERGGLDEKSVFSDRAGAFVYYHVSPRH